MAHLGLSGLSEDDAGRGGLLHLRSIVLIESAENASISIGLALYQVANFPLYAEPTFTNLGRACKDSVSPLLRGWDMVSTSDHT
jgi:hypothetical protein